MLGMNSSFGFCFADMRMLWIDSIFDPLPDADNLELSRLTFTSKVSEYLVFKRMKYAKVRVCGIVGVNDLEEGDDSDEESSDDDASDTDDGSSESAEEGSSDDNNSSDEEVEEEQEQQDVS